MFVQVDARTPSLAAPRAMTLDILTLEHEVVRIPSEPPSECQLLMFKPLTFLAHKIRPAVVVPLTDTFEMFNSVTVSGDDAELA